jgi:NitT/TauT family transport system substrate-binding protein
VGVKPWVGYCPLGVADDADLCKPYRLKFVKVTDLNDALSKMENGEIDVMMCPVETLVYARGNRHRIKAVLKADESFGADAVVAVPEVQRVSDLRGRKVAFASLEAPHYLLWGLLAGEEMRMQDIEVEPCADVKEALDKFNDGKVAAAAIYAPFLDKRKKDSHVLAQSGERGDGKRPIIVDVLAVHDDWLKPEKREGVKALVRGWCAGVRRLEDEDESAILSARRFLAQRIGAPDYSENEYREAAAGMKYSGHDDNLAFFNPTDGVSDFHQRLSVSRKRFDDIALLKIAVEPQECDASDVIRGMFRR